MLKDLENDLAVLELQILGILGKTLTGPWMKRFYTSSENEINHIDGIDIVKSVVDNLKKMLKDPCSILTTSTDLFGDALVIDSMLVQLRAIPATTNFKQLMKVCLEAIIQVLERQYAKYFALNVTDTLRREAESARSHNIDSEEIMGMFSSAKKKSANATLCYLSCRMRSSKNNTVDCLDDLPEERREDVLHRAIKWGRVQRNKRKKRQVEIRADIIKRQKEKEHLRDTKDRKKVERKLKECGLELEDVRKDYPNLDFTKTEDLEDVLQGKVVGRKACHAWFEMTGLVVYNAKFEKFKKTKVYRVAYWSL